MSATEGNVRRLTVSDIGRMYADGERIQTVACPGLGTATGRVPATEAARQMALAYHYAQNPPQAMSWPAAAARHRRILGG